MKLESKHLAPYLPYGLNIKFISKYEADRLSIDNVIILKEIKDGAICVNGYKTNNKSYLPILRPLSDLTKEIEINGERFVPVEWLENKYYTLDLHKQCLKFLEEDGENWINQSDYMLIMHLFEWHFDVFSLIESGLAIDINTLTKNK